MERGQHPHPAKEHIANEEQIVYSAALAIPEGRGARGGKFRRPLSVPRFPAIRSFDPNECSAASSRRRIVHGQIQGP